MRFLSLTLIIFLCIGQPLSGQHYTPEEINLEKMLIDASREKILKNYEKAIAILEQAYKLQENNAPVAFELGRLYAIRGDSENAVKMLKIAVENGKDNQWYYKELLEVYRHTGRYEDALELCQELVDLHPHTKDYYYDLAWYYTVLNKFQKAIKVYDKIESKFGYDEPIASRRHRLHLISGDHKKAEKEYIRLTKSFPNNANYYLLLAQYYINKGDRNKANEVFQQILTFDPGNPKASLALAGNQSKNKNDLDYINALKPVFEQETVNIDMKIERLIPIITKVADTGDQELADAGIELTAILERIHANDPKGFAASGDLFYHSNRPEPALEKYKSSLSLSESNFLVWENVMYIYLETGDYEKLLKTTNEVIDIFPNKAVTFYLSGVANHELGKSKTALTELSQALLMSAKDVVLKYKIYTLQGKIYCKTGQADKADNAFKKAIELNSQEKDKLNCNDIK